ncbi:proton-conducting transporter transmembrane domain-containing protein [Micromonospora siamensis]|uniref:NADH:ubiquinone oxidoreductase subunit 5 (Chain L)/Multisubunit Na+/H+ antiporter, MnhA subunit n=1 Tax=Micromonospora siamensis TaxID=299152 RepID=A0A1C5I6P9_9ACTN|nr:proton-conducting transporter membrane subunit [Micromonospora siamensis]SCG53980.1 NADH:ubiquinone oxidoreductase subunit 5 (chain L)/Multisubunit Na+/H+ antiporter, MnhA subunit [Micromonospora siamensis]
MSGALWALVALPALAGGVLLLAGRRAGRIAAPAALGVAVLVTALAGLVAATRPAVDAPFLAGARWGLAVDGLAALVVPAVAGVALLVLAYAAVEIHRHRARFHGLMLVFLAAVLLTATATSLPVLLLAWEVMGAMSYALIAFHWRRDDAVTAGATAFLTTRVGDLGLYLAAGAALAAAGTLDLTGLAALPTGWRDLAAAGVLAAGFGKAAQLPFSFWLSRAMLGPSPVSALLHSAAMVAMGGYLLIRLHPLLAATGWAVDVAAWGGAATALALGAVALAQADLKQLLAASTSAQLGYVVLGAAVAPAGAVAHLVAHAATKALLFLAAGAWLTALGTRRLSALRGAGRRYPLVGAAFAVGAVALAGVPPLALWATKDEVLAGAREHSFALYLVGLAGALLAALYAGRALAVVLRPAPSDVESGYDGTREVSAGQRLLLVPLAVGAVLLGVLALPPLAGRVAGTVGLGPAPPARPAELALSGLLALAGLAVAVAAPDRLPAPAWALRWLGLEAAARLLLVRPTLALARALARFDDRVLDRGVHAVPRAAVVAAGTLARFDDAVLDRGVTGATIGTRRLADVLARADDHGVDGTVRRLTGLARRLGALARRPQTGLVHQYYVQVVVALGAAVLILLLMR